MSALGSERIMWSGDIRRRFEQFVEYYNKNSNLPETQHEKQMILDELAELSIRLIFLTC